MISKYSFQSLKIHILGWADIVWSWNKICTIRSKTKEGIYLVPYVGRDACSGLIHGLEEAESFDAPRLSKTPLCNTELLKAPNFLGDQVIEVIETGTK